MVCFLKKLFFFIQIPLGSDLQDDTDFPWDEADGRIDQVRDFLLYLTSCERLTHYPQKIFKYAEIDPSGPPISKLFFSSFSRFKPMLRWPSEPGALYTVVMSNLDINNRRNR